jgi:hypothetical protein
MKIAAGQQLSLAIVEPSFLDKCLTFRAMSVPARIIGYALELTLIALLSMTAQYSRSAYFNMVHDLVLFV